MKTAQGNGFTVTFDPAKHAYQIDGKPVPSVTQILGVLDKPGLPWWGMKVGVAGVCALIDNGHGVLDWEHPEAMRDGRA